MTHDAADSPANDGVAAWPLPEWNDAGSVALALQRLREANDEASAMEAADQFLWAVGNNHAGTYFPVALAVLPALKEVLSEGGPWARRAVLESAIDLAGPFMPQAGHEVHEGVSVQSALRAEVVSWRPVVASLAGGTDASASSAGELLELIDDLAG